MSKILEKGDTGFGILIEGDAGEVSGIIKDGIIAEGILDLDPKQPVTVNCILQKWGVENKNGRIYPKEVLMPQVEAHQELVSTGAAVSEADHPDSSVVSLHNISHLLKKMWWGNGNDENILYGQLEIITSPAYMRDGIVSMVGDKIVEYLKRGVKLGISSRGVGTLKEVNGKNIVQPDFELICFDLVASPSTPGAYLFPEKTEMDFTGMDENIKMKGKNLTEQQKRTLNAINRFVL